MTPLASLNRQLRRPEVVLPALLFALLWLQGSTLGLSDDEAYYWVLAQKLQLAYAFHPPAVAWVIRAFQGALGWALGAANPALVRLPAALSAAGVLALGISWMRDASGKSSTPLRGDGLRSRESGLWLGGLALLSFVGFFGVAWMMVPDLPLMLGWMILFSATWSYCREGRGGAWLAVGSALLLLSKYSAVLAIFSAAVSLLLWAPRQKRIAGLVALGLGTLAALVPILLWNAEHGWGSILYQLRDRQGADWSLVRYARFWVIQLLLVGPPLLAYSIRLLLRPRWREGPRAFVWVWMAPAAAVFCLQPLRSDFKAHWALVVWLPAALCFGMEVTRGELTRLFRIQATYASVVGAAALLACQFPVTTWFTQGVLNKPADPRFDLSNDFRGWQGLGEWLATLPGGDVPVVGSRYQTASQAAFALADTARARVTLLPRDQKARDEWPDLGVSQSSGPDWPRLSAPVIFVADHRYGAGPEFPGADCRMLGRRLSFNHGAPSRRIDAWRCEAAKPSAPSSALPVPPAKREPS